MKQARDQGSGRWCVFEGGVLRRRSNNLRSDRHYLFIVDSTASVSSPSLPSPNPLLRPRECRAALEVWTSSLRKRHARIGVDRLPE